MSDTAVAALIAALFPFTEDGPLPPTVEEFRQQLLEVRHADHG